MIRNLNHSYDSNRNPQDKLIEYQSNMRIFISEVEKQMSSIIDKYENKIKELNAEIKRLQNELSKRNAKLDVSEQLSPIKFKSEMIASIKNSNSNFMEDFPMKTFFGLDSKIQNTQHTYKKMPSFDYKFQIQSSPDKLNKSRFEVQKTNKKQRQQQLIHSLESGRMNLELSTSKMFQLVGRNKPQSQNTIENEEEDSKGDSNSRKRKNIQKLNSSLSSICESLDNSFHGRKAQAKSLKKRQQKMVKQQQERKRQIQNQSKRKQQGLKNLLTSMRNNIGASAQKQPQIIKGSKLLTTGQRKSSAQLSKGKVMFNPVPVDISNRNRMKEQNSTTSAPSPSKNPQSILKNSNNNFFSKSIQNISAISFHDTSAYQ